MTALLNVESKLVLGKKRIFVLKILNSKRELANFHQQEKVHPCWHQGWLPGTPVIQKWVASADRLWQCKLEL